MFDLLHQRGLLDPRKPVHHAAGSDYWFRRLFEIVPAEHLAKKTPAHITISRFVLALMELLADSKSSQPPAPQPDWVEKARALLTDDDMTAGKIASVARKLGFPTTRSASGSGRRWAIRPGSSAWTPASTAPRRCSTRAVKP